MAIKVLIEGYVEVEVMESTDVRMLHLLRGNGKKACHCRYGKGRSAAVATPKTLHVEGQQLQRDTDGYLYVDEAEEYLVVKVVLCEKSERELSRSLQAWQKWEGKE